MILNDLDLNLKLAMPTLSATIGADMYDKLCNKCPNTEILYYSGITSYAENLDIAHILDKWTVVIVPRLECRATKLVPI